MEGPGCFLGLAASYEFPVQAAANGSSVLWVFKPAPKELEKGYSFPHLHSLLATIEQWFSMCGGHRAPGGLMKAQVLLVE